MQVTKTTCPYCGVGCGVLVRQDKNHTFSVSPDPDHPANQGRLCSKGTALAETLAHPERLLYPEIGTQRVSWDEAIDTVATRFQSIIREHGADAVAFYVSGQLLTEDYYVANKLMKGFIGSANIDTNSRLCMASAVAAHKRAFGEDLVPCTYADLDEAELIVLVGSNAAWCHPVLFQRMVRAKKANPALKVINIDPRRTQTSDLADLHLGLAPGSDTSLFNGLLVWLADNGQMATDFITQSTNGIEDALAAARDSTPHIQAVAEQCQLDTEQLEQFFRLFGSTEKVVTVFSQGINQSSSGTDKANAIINCHLLTGRIGKPGRGPFSFTGQPNAMGGREVGGLANQLAAHMALENPAQRDLVQRFWQSPHIAQKSGLKAVDLFDAIYEGRVKAVWIMATNPAVSMPDSTRVREALARCECVVVSDCVRHTDTADLAHIRLPALGWGERDGTVTNSDRTISRQRPFLSAPGEARQDWEILTQVAQELGFGTHFRYQSAHEVFCEHAALSAFENNGTRCFDIGAWQHLSQADYDALSPTPWPLDKTRQGTLRLFSDGHFFTPSGKAQFVSVTPRLPQSVRTPDYPFVLNTGRVRDHWHTLTRTGISARLSAHSSEPYVEIHPCDARDQKLADGALARLYNDRGELLLRVKTSRNQQRGSLFVPMHWSQQFSTGATVGQLIPPITDPVSGQPESKHATVAIAPYTPNWHGFVVSKRKLISGLASSLSERSTPIPDPIYASAFRVEQGWCHELAGVGTIADWSVLARTLFCQTDSMGSWSEYSDTALQTYRAARFVNDQLESCLFISTITRPLPERAWIISLLAQDSLQPAERMNLLAGKALQPGEDQGRTVCACFNVGEKRIRRAIKEQSLTTVESIGQCLQAGTNCGSCVPELKAMLD
ncbi:nitrate reductase [Thiofilum flexile]|uniref:nitrate reductase n=1 Tax=Thiofilum flexile TaxID=125627 RepID=UPI00035F8708|nr:nitrate reductase [Thiofilum flexile]